MANLAKLEELTIEDSISAVEIATTTTVTTKKTTTNFKQTAASTIQAKPKIPEYNILLLGETGAGKSTTINAFANYLRYSSFEEASSSEFIQLIPSKFTLPDPETGEPQVIQSGSDSNELYGDDTEDGGGGGSSVTQRPMGYTFPFGDGLIRIIDTPRMGETSGVNSDEQNFEKILGYLHLHKNWHGICILMKSNEMRKTTSFRYFINELLTHLHKSACKNIVFCFTFSRSSYYGPGEGFATLNGFFKNELKDVKLEMKLDENCFFVDNEAFRFLVAQKEGYTFLELQQASAKESWNRSVKQTIKMMEHIMKTEPHDMVHTTSLSNARKMILELAEQMVRLQKNARASIKHIEQQEAELLTSTITNATDKHMKHKQIKSIENAISQIKADLAIRRQFVEENQCELKVIQEVCSKFAYIPIAHSNTVYNRFIEPYLDLQIKEEKKKIAAIKGYPKTIMDSLFKKKEIHLESVEILTNAVKCNAMQQSSPSREMM